MSESQGDHVEVECTSSHLTQIPLKGEKEIRLVLIGKTGHGKSAFGNTILSADRFKSETGGTSVTTETNVEEVKRGDQIVVVVDTPGLFDTHKDLTEKSIKKEILKCLAMTAPGPHAFLFVVSCSGRITEEEIQTFREFLSLFGKEISNYIVVIFTRKRDVRKQTEKKYISSLPEDFRHFIRECDDRIFFVENDVEQNERTNDLQEFFDIINKMVKRTNSFYSNPILQIAQEQLQQYLQEEFIKNKDLRHEVKKLNESIEKVRENYRKDIANEGTKYKELKRSIQNISFGTVSAGVTGAVGGGILGFFIGGPIGATVGVIAGFSAGSTAGASGGAAFNQLTTKTCSIS